MTHLLYDRAIRAYFRYSDFPDQPANTSGLRIYEGKSYIVLENANRTLAVYRITPSGKLRSLKRWPSAIDHYYAALELDLTDEPSPSAEAHAREDS